jgi:hypothetical protein
LRGWILFSGFLFLFLFLNLRRIVWLRLSPCDYLFPLLKLGRCLPFWKLLRNNLLLRGRNDLFNGFRGWSLLGSFRWRGLFLLW